MVENPDINVFDTANYDKWFSEKRIELYERNLVNWNFKSKQEVEEAE